MHIVMKTLKINEEEAKAIWNAIYTQVEILEKSKDAEARYELKILKKLLKKAGKK